MSRTVTIAWKGKSYLVELVPIDEHGHELEAVAALAWGSMSVAAERDGVALSARTAYRSAAFQTELRQRYEAYETYLRDVAAWEEGRVGEAPAKVDWAALAAKPGTSEHEIGRAVDVERHVDKPDLTARIDGWLDAHAAEHGWNRDVNGERWHYAWWAAPLVAEAPAVSA